MNGNPYSRDELLSLARQVAQRASAKYSGFRVGAVVVANNKLYFGVNIESSSYGLSLCAERSALAAAISDGSTAVEKIAICCLDADKSLGAAQLMPCGACRQWLTDFAEEAIVMIDGILGEYKVEDLLPDSFRL